MDLTLPQDSNTGQKQEQRSQAWAEYGRAISAVAAHHAGLPLGVFNTYRSANSMQQKIRQQELLAKCVCLGLEGAD